MLCEGWSRRNKRQRQMRAWIVANLMNATGNMKETVTIDSLLNGTGPATEFNMEKIRKRAEERRRERLALRGSTT